jgi:hypothetical protein
MNQPKIRSAFLVAAASCVLVWARSAAAQCATDIDCPGPLCGDPVCQHSVGGSACVAAGTDVAGYDGSCTADADCKCINQGARCDPTSFHCTFTQPQDGGATTTTTTTTADAGASPATSPGCEVGRGGEQDGIVIGLACVAGMAMARRRRER